MTGREAHLCFADVVRFARTHLTCRVVYASVRARCKLTRTQWWDGRCANGEKVWSQAADEYLDETLEERRCCEGVAETDKLTVF